MITSRRLFALFSLLLVSVFLSPGETLTRQQQAKLHRFFQGVVARQFPQLLKARNVINAAETTTGATATTRYDAIIYTGDATTVRSMGIHVNSVYPEFITAQVTASDLVRLINIQSIKFIDRGTTNYPQLDVSVPETGASLLQSGFINNTAYQGNGAIVVIYDTGIDWKHLDFRKSDTTKSRILFIWDQTDTLGTSVHPDGFSYGAEYTQAQIEDELDGTPAGFVREADIHGHGTHVASTAAGNGLASNGKFTGMAPEADIIVIKGGNGSFEESKMIDGLTYAQNKATALGKPIVLNWSIGGQYGSHDGTRPYEVAVDAFVTNPGRVVCISAGNNGTSLMHFGGTATTTTMDTIKVTVPASRTSGKNNDYFDLDCWLLDSTMTGVIVKSPTDATYIFPSNSEIDSSSADGGIYVWNYISLQNHHREIFVEIYDPSADVITNGTWSIAFTKPSGTSTFDAWLAGSNFGGNGATLIYGNTSKTVSMPGTSAGAITVGSYVTKATWSNYLGNTSQSGQVENSISIFSSKGPTGDNRLKPDITAPGDYIGAALSGDANTTGYANYILEGKKHWLMHGTSMACPHVTGGTALLLGANPSLTASQIKTLYTSTANTDSYTSTVPNNTWGYGKYDVLEALAKSIWSTAVVTRTTLAYDGTGTSSFFRVTGYQKADLKFSPTIDGVLTGLQIFIDVPQYRPVVGNGPLICEIYTDNAGVPGTKIGGSVNQPFNLLSPYNNNYIQMTSASVTVSSGTIYHAVLSVANATDSVLVRYEAVTTGTHSLTYNGSTWAPQSYNLRVRPIVTSTSGLTGVNDQLTQEQPNRYILDQNYPNPFNPATKISYTIPTASKVTLKIFNLLGQVVATLVDERQEANSYVQEFDASRLASGTYFYQLTAGNFTDTKKMILLK